MTAVHSDFYVTGGALQQTAPCYVLRRADRDLYEGLARGEFCYVLTPRQMGKSSLMVRTAQRLQQAGATVIVLDLTSIGQNLDLQKWYGGLLASIGQQLDLDDELDDFWWNNEKMGTLQRWMAAIQQVVLPRCSSLVIFVDEIDVVRSLPFSTDEFFAAIRACYNQRSENAALRGLTFCLLGVATPSDLIRDTRMTPFNIGQRIELNDFSVKDAAVLAEGLAGDEQTADELLERILYWTNGHPYLTQRLCRAVASDPTALRSTDVDRVCNSAFLSQGARQQDSNLIFVRERILRSDGDLAGVLEEYARVLRRRRVRHDERSPLHGTLRLSGITRSDDGYLLVRNRIYERVFDRDWIKASMPDAELRRQKAAFRRGLWRASAVASIFILILAASAFVAVNKWQEAEAMRARADTTAALAQQSLIKERQALAKEAQARSDAEQARDEAERERQRARTLQEQAEREHELAESARAEETKHRERAEREKQAAIASKAETEDALKTAEAARQAAERAQRAAEEEKRKAEAAEIQVELRGRLFAKLVPLLQEYAVEGVRAYAENLAQEGKYHEALNTLEDFCRLSIGEQQGFLAHELLELDSGDLQVLDAETAGVQISVSPVALLEHVLMPGIRLGEQQLERQTDDQLKTLVARLYTYQARLLKRNPAETWPNGLSTAETVYVSYDRAARLEPDEYRHFLGRAAAGFRLPERDFAGILADVDKAIQLYTPPDALRTGETREEARREYARLHHARANVLEFLADSAAPAQRDELLHQAEQAHGRAIEFDTRNADYLVGLARSVQKRAIIRTATPSADTLQRLERLLNEAIRLNAELPEAHNELGQLYLMRGEVALARRSFKTAIERSRETNRPLSLYSYYCNLAIALSRGSADTPADHVRALEAAEAAVALGVDQPVDGHYYRGSSMWKLGRTAEALAALAEVLNLNPDHVETLLTRCQIVFEMQASDPATAAQVSDAYDDIARVLAKSDLNREQRAKALYVNSLGWLRYHKNQASDRSLGQCLDFALQAAEQSGSPVYAAFARQIFQYASGWQWQDSQWQERSRVLRDRLSSIPGQATN